MLFLIKISFIIKQRRIEMKNKLLIAATTLLISFGAPMAANAANVGEAAPAFSVQDTNGNTVNLSELKGKTVVLEWTNHQCPYVRKHYDTKNMQNSQKTATADEDTIWLTVVSSAPGKQGYVSAEEANKIVEDEGAMPTAKILDPSGELGKLYEAKTTPHMYVIDAEGNLAYQGAIDSNSSFKAETVEGATNYVLAALDSLEKGEAVEVSSTKPYGCGIKY
tara:strand:- start:362 stop:1024 length:663 start_codon:yes stop_codon:yes gene_type:complete